ncbi:MAG: rhodanese-like domain-containing protein [Deltaproteobacteria bacterium]|nr:rhodanese-like domain-containing protein [Deltaproteobacteria bacterium]
MNFIAGRKNILSSLNLRSLFREAALICLVGAALGLGVNQALVRDVLFGHEPIATVVPSESGGPAFPVAIEDVVRMLKSGAVAVDARAREFFAEGHLPGALSLSVGELDEALALFMEKVPLNTALIVYCSGYGCPDSEDVAMRLMSAGFSDVRIYEGGFPEWRDAGLPVETGGQP